MGWSTREVAELAGTTLRAVRHYHEMGLLPEPPRSANGYKRYGVTHLRQLLRVRGLVDLGAPLSRIGAMDPDTDRYEDALRALDAEAAAAIERLRGVRAEIARQLCQEAGPVPFDRLDTTARTTPDDDFMVVLSRLLDEDAFREWRELSDQPPEEESLAEFTGLRADAGPDTRRDLGGRLAEAVRALYEQAPTLRDPRLMEGRGRSFAARSIRVAVTDLYNPAQVDVITRVSRELARGGAR